MIQNKNQILKDISLWVLLGSNSMMIYLAISQNWNIRSLIFIFWLQSVIIGFFIFLRILSLKNEVFSYSLKDSLVKNLFYQKISFAFFFTMHFGLFSFFTLIVAMMVTRTDKWSLIAPEMVNIMLMGGIFFINHLFSFLYNNSQEGRRDEYVGVVFLLPYIRIAPLIFMFFIAPFALSINPIKGIDQIILILFLIFKTVFDMVGHIFQHKMSNNKIS